MTGNAVPTRLLLLAALSSAAVSNGVSKDIAPKRLQAQPTNTSAIPPQSRDLAPQESKKVHSQLPSKRPIRKFDFDAEFASYLGLASQDETARYLAGDKSSSYKVPTELGPAEGIPYTSLRPVPGSTPASFAYFTQIYPDKNNQGDIRIEHFNPILHPRSSERTKTRYSQDHDTDDEADDDDDIPVRYERGGSNIYPSKNSPLLPPPTSRSYFGRYLNTQRTVDSPETAEDPPKSSKLPTSKEPYKKPLNLDDDSIPDYKMGYRQFGMYHKVTEEDLYPKKTSSEWIPTHPKAAKNTDHSEGEPEGKYFDDYPDLYHDAEVSSEDFHVQSKHDDEIMAIKSSINKDPPYATKNFNLGKEKASSIGKLKKTGPQEGVEDFGKGYSAKGSLDEEPFEPVKHKRRRKNRHKHKKKHHRHHHGRPAFRNFPELGASAPFKDHPQSSKEKDPSFEFYNPVNSYVSPPYSPPEPYKSPQESFKDPPKRSKALQESSKALQRPFETAQKPLGTAPENHLPLSTEDEKEDFFEELEKPEGTEDDYGPIKEDDLDEDYYMIREAGPREHAEHSKDFDKRLPKPNGKVYGSFETFDSQLEPSSNKKFEPFVKYPFEEQRQKLKTVVDELIQDGTSR